MLKASVNAVAIVAIGAAAQSSIAGWTPTELTASDPTKLLGTINTDSIAIGSSVTDGKADATGSRAIAIGKSAAATKMNTIAIGAGAQSLGPNSSSLGTGAVASATDALAIGTGATAGDGKGNGSGQGAIAIGASASAQNQGSIAIGKGTTVEEDNAIAIGSGATSKKGAVVVGVSSIGSEGAVALNGNATGVNAVSIGTNSEAKTSNAVAVGYKSKAGVSAIGIGNEAFAYATDSIAIGRASTVNPASGIGSVAIGQDNTISVQNTFVLGSNVNPNVANSVVLGSQSALERVYTDVDNPTITSIDADGNQQSKVYNHTYAGQPVAANGAVSVGQKGGERQIQHVAAGRVTSTSTDAVNGSQLYNVLAEVNTVEQNMGWNVSVDDGAKKLIKDKDDIVNFKAGSNVNLNQTDRTDGADISVSLSDTIGLTNAGNLTIAGSSGGTGPIQLQQGNVSLGNNQLHDIAAGTANTDAVNLKQLKDSSWTAKTADSSSQVKTDNSVGFYGDTAENIKITQKSNTEGTDIAIALAKDLDLGTDGSVQMGDTLLNGTGLTLVGGPSITTVGINAGDKKITNVAAGVDATDAVNVDQLKNNSFKLTSSNAKGAKNQLIKSDDTINITTEDKDSNLVVTQSDGNVKFALAKQVDLGATGSISVGPVVINNTGINAGNKKITNVAAGVDDTDAVNVGQLKKQIGENDYTWSVATGDQTTAVAKGNTVGFDGGKNLSVKQAERKDKDGKVVGTDILVELEKDIDLGADGSLSIGNSVLNNQGLNVGTGTTAIIIQQGNISVGGNKIQNVADGVEAKDAVNVSQLKDAGNWTIAGKDAAGKTVSTDINNNTVEFAAGKNINVSTTATKDGAKVLVELAKDIDVTDGSIKAGNVLINKDGINAGGKQITNVAAGTKGTDAVNLDQLNTVVGNVGWNLAGKDGKGQTVNEKITDDKTVEFAAGKNISVNTEATKNGGKITVELAKDIDVTDGSIKAGDVVINKGGINAGDNKITNVADGDIVAGSKDAVNGGQLHELLDKVGSWDIVGVDSSGKAVDKTIGTGQKVGFTAGSNNIVVNTNANNKGAGVVVDLAKDLSVDSINVGGTVNINKGGIDAGNTVIKNVAAGKNKTDAVNVGQLDATNTYITKTFGGDSSYNPTTQEFTGPTYNVQGDQYYNVGDAIEAIDVGINNTYKYMDNIKKKMSAGIASAMAMESAPFIAGKYTYAAGTAYHEGEGALGLTLRKTADNGRWSLTGGVAAGTEGDPSVRVGISGVLD